MKVILYITEPKEMAHAEIVLRAAIEDAELGTCGFTHMDGRSSVYQRHKSGTVVVHVLPKKAKPASPLSPSPAKESEKV
jgi:hypothetical protein